jgi:putative protein-disulfide isomerase
MPTTCDPLTGVCTLPDVEVADCGPVRDTQLLVTYAGDPMCSWCWGMSPVIDHLARWCAQEGHQLRLVMGGLRAGGGDPWNAGFRSFLREEWTVIQARTGQPFGFGLLERPYFNYDTEPACRAIVVARQLFDPDPTRQRELGFFAAVQKKFYVDGMDPSDADFYRDICDEFGLEFGFFCSAFASAEAHQAVVSDFRVTRELGVRGFPSVVVEVAGQTHLVSAGYVSFPDLESRLRAVMLA